MTQPVSGDAIVLLIRIHPPESSDRAALYERVRKWWKMSLAQAERAERVLAIVNGTVVEVYEPQQWLDAPADEAEGRIGFVGHVASDREHWVGVSVQHLFKPGAANPVRYLPANVLETRVAAAEADSELALLLRLNQSWHDGISPKELYDVSRAWWVLAPSKAEQVTRVLAVAGGIVREVYEPNEWMPSPVPGLENRIGFEGVVASDRDMFLGLDVYPAQLTKYNDYDLPWSSGHSSSGADNTRYVLLSLMHPSFPLPRPWIKEAARAAVVESSYLDFFNHTDVAAILGSDLKSKTYQPGQWNHFNPDFVYRYRPVKPSVSTGVLAPAPPKGREKQQLAYSEA